MSEIKTFSQAIEYLNSYIPEGKEFKFPGNHGLLRTKYLLKLLGEPQHKVKIIHVAGTSGKGSTCYLISQLIGGLGQSVGLSLSPHLLDIRERFMVNNKLISKSDFCKYLSEICTAVESMESTKFGRPTYFELTAVLAYYIFAKLKLDCAVMETGLGGMYDATNVVESVDKLAVITRIGHDHTMILGKTLSLIAAQKAGIIQDRNIVITIDQNRRALDVIREAAKAKKAQIHVVGKSNSQNITLTPRPKFDFVFDDCFVRDISLGMSGSFQVENCTLALSGVAAIAKRDGFIFDNLKIKTVLANVQFLGRMQVIQTKGSEVVIDGAHNPQKMAAFTKSLKQYYPGQKFSFLIAFKRGKDYLDILRYVVPLAKQIIVTSFFNQTKEQGMAVIAEDTEVITRTLKQLNFSNYEVCEDNRVAFDKQLVASGLKVVTGSLYLLSDVYPILVPQ